MYLLNGSTHINWEKKEAAKRRQSKALFTQAIDDIEHLPYDTVLQNGTTKADLIRFVDRYNNCSTNEIVGHYSHNGERKHKTLHKNACNEVRFCKICANKKQAERYSKILPLLDRISYKTHNAYLMTFTQENTTDLYTSLRDMNDSFRRWYKQGEKNRFGEYSKIIAGIKSVEVKRGDNLGMWHVHIHFLAITKKSDRIDYQKWDRGYFEQKRNDAADILTPQKYDEDYKDHMCKNARLLPYKNRLYAVSKIGQEWYRATGGRSLWVDVQPIFISKQIDSDFVPSKYKSTHQSLKSAIHEVLKYQTKINEMAANDLAVIFDATRGTRAFEFVGMFREWDINSDSNDYKKSVKRAERELKNQINSDQKTRKLYKERLNSAIFTQVKWDKKNCEMNYFDYNMGKKTFPLLQFPDAIEILYKRQGEIVAYYNKCCRDLKTYIGKIPNHEYVHLKHEFYQTMKMKLKELWKVVRDTTSQLDFMERVEKLLSKPEAERYRCAPIDTVPEWLEKLIDTVDEERRYREKHYITEIRNHQLLPAL